MEGVRVMALGGVESAVCGLAHIVQDVFLGGRQATRGGTARRALLGYVPFSAVIHDRSIGRSSNSVLSTTVLVVRATPAIALIS